MRRAAPLERVLEPEQRRDFVADAAPVERENQVRIDQQAIDDVDLEARGAAQVVERLLRKRDVPEHRHVVPRVEVLGNQPLDVDQVAAEHVERDGQAIVCSEIGTGRIHHLIRKVRRFAGRRIPCQHARAVPLVTDVDVGGHTLDSAREDDERLHGGRARAEQVQLVAGGQTDIGSDGGVEPAIGGQRSLAPHRDIPDSMSVANRGEYPLRAHFTVGLTEEMGQRVGRPEAVDRRVRHDPNRIRDDRHCHRHIESVGDTDRHETRVLTDRRRDRILRRDDVLPAAEQLGVVVGEDGRHVAERQALDRIEREPLGGESERNAARTDRFGAFGEDRPEALRGALEDAGARVEVVGEAGGRGGQRHRNELADHRGAELAEVRLEIVVEVRRVRDVPRQGFFAVDNQAARAEQVAEQRREILNRRGQIVRILRASARRQRKETQREHKRSSHRPISRMTQLEPLRTRVMV